jgi:hypothetical protein
VKANNSEKRAHPDTDVVGTSRREQGSEDGSPTTKKRKKSSGTFTKFVVESSDEEPDPWAEDVVEFIEKKVGKLVGHLYATWNAIPKGSELKTVRTTARKEMGAASEEASEIGALARDLVRWAHGEGPKPSLKGSEIEKPRKQCVPDSVAS